MIQAFLQRLARWLDRPLFPWKKLVVGFSLAEFALENWLLFRQYRVLQRTIVPKALNKEIDQQTFDKSQVRRSIRARDLVAFGLHVVSREQLLTTQLAGIWSRKGQVQLRLGALQPGQTPRYSLLQRLPDPLERCRLARRPLCSRQPVRRDPAVAAVRIPHDLG